MEPFRGIASLQFLVFVSLSFIYFLKINGQNYWEAKELLPTCSSTQKSNVKENKSQKIAHFDL